MSPEIADYLQIMAGQRAALLGAVKGLPVEALDWTPLPSDASSLSVLAHHCSGVARLWLVEGLTGRDSGRNRDAEFAASGLDAGALTAVINGAFDDAEAALKSLDPARLDQPVEITFNRRRRGETHTPRFFIATPITHIAEHIGHMQLTRQLWEPRSS